MVQINFKQYLNISNKQFKIFRFFNKNDRFYLGRIFRDVQIDIFEHFRKNRIQKIGIDQFQKEHTLREYDIHLVFSPIF